MGRLLRMRFKDLPSVSRLLQDPRLAGLSHDLAVRVAREVIEDARQRIRAGEAVSPLADAAAQRAEALCRPRLVPVINATGIVLHTNLGRAPMSPEAAAAAAAVAGGYSSLEMHLSTGKRGGRLEGIAAPLCELTGAEAAIGVNNNAAGVLLALTALARGKEVIVSRGELVEIGGSFRVPDVISDGGARLVEVGATNRTRLSDYADAITENTAVLLRVHASNFRMIGFTERPDRAALCALARERGVLVVDDLGSGLLHSAPAMERSVVELEAEELVSNAIADGVDAVCFSGDKLLGGPQAGMIVGRSPVIQKMRRHPLYRALRLDKMVLAALEATLLLYRQGRQNEAIPARRMLAMTAAQCREAADRIAAEIPGSRVEADTSYSGGGALPAQGLPTFVVAVPVKRPDAFCAALRQGSPSIVARVARDTLILDPRTLLPGDAEVLIDAIRSRRS
ncbi:MAG: L-seryl-tRNA(Sec) selenium transferase [Myxococcota bacterium]|nr:L-seryl-tRNA(Sec) selenium transferase [Myxococcota bacterium]